MDRMVTIRVSVHIFGELSSRLGSRIDVELSRGATIRSLLRLLSERGVSFRVGGEGVAILVNGVNIALLKGLDTELSDGDRVVLIPPMSGG